jgi:hypothetical protein
MVLERLWLRGELVRWGIRGHVKIPAGGVFSKRRDGLRRGSARRGHVGPSTVIVRIIHLPGLAAEGYLAHPPRLMGPLRGRPA